MEKSKSLPYLQRISVFLIASLLGLCSCDQESAGTDKATEVVAVNVSADILRLQPCNLYKNDSITAFLTRVSTEQNQKAAGSIYESYKRNSAVEGADQNKTAWLLKNALTYYPNRLWYGELGNVLMQARMFNEAKEAYFIYLKAAESSSPEQMLNILKATMLADNNEGRYDVGVKAKAAGVTEEQFKSLFQETEIQKRMSQKEIKSYLEYLLRYVGEGVEADTTLPDFNKFSQEFESVDLPLKIGEEELAKHEYSEEYFDYDPSRDFSKFYYERSQNLGFYPDYDFKYKFRNGPYTALIYSADTSATASLRKNRCVYHRLLIYDAAGNLTSTQVVGIHAGEQLRTYEIDKSGNVKVYDFSREWKYPFDKKSMDNEIVGRQSKDTVFLRIGKGGIIETE